MNVFEIVLAALIFVVAIILVFLIREIRLQKKQNALFYSGLKSVMKDQTRKIKTDISQDHGLIQAMSVKVDDIVSKETNSANYQMKEFSSIFNMAKSIDKRLYNIDSTSSFIAQTMADEYSKKKEGFSDDTIEELYDYYQTFIFDDEDAFVRAVEDGLQLLWEKELNPQNKNTLEKDTK